MRFNSSKFRPGPLRSAHLPGAMLVAAIAAAPLNAADDLPRGLAAISPSEFAGSAEVIDDDLEPALVISTRGTYSKTRKLDGARAHDVYLTARIDRAKGEISYHVVHDLAYWAPRRSFTHVHFNDGDQLVTREVTVVRSGDEFCEVDSAIGECRVFQTLSFELSEGEMTRLARGYISGSREPWRLRLKDAFGRDVTSGLAPAEAGGLLQAVSRFHDEAS